MYFKSSEKSGAADVICFIQMGAICCIQFLVNDCISIYDVHYLLTESIIFNVSMYACSVSISSVSGLPLPFLAESWEYCEDGVDNPGLAEKAPAEEVDEEEANVDADNMF